MYNSLVRDSEQNREQTMQQNKHHQPNQKLKKDEHRFHENRPHYLKQKEVPKFPEETLYEVDVELAAMMADYQTEKLPSTEYSESIDTLRKQVATHLAQAALNPKKSDYAEELMRLFSVETHDPELYALYQQTIMDLKQKPQVQVKEHDHLGQGVSDQILSHKR